MITIRPFINIKYIFHPQKLIPSYFLSNKLTSYLFSTVPPPPSNKKLQLYQKIRQRQMENISKNKLNSSSIEKYYKVHHCDGCNSVLQSQDNTKYGFIKKQAIDKSVSNNIKIIEDNYGTKIAESDSKTLEIIHNVEKQLGVQIFNNQTKRLDNLDSVSVLLRLQEKIDDYEENEQKIKRVKKLRKEILCERCYSLKYRNRLPDQYDNNDDKLAFGIQTIMTKMLKKHENKQAFYLYLVDALDISGGLKKQVFDVLLQNNCDMAIVINKLDVINEKYINKHLIMADVRNIINDFVKDRIHLDNVAQKVKNIKVFLTSGLNKEGLKAIQELIQKKQIKRIQFVGFPNTGKTTLLNQLARTSKVTSKIPGTTLFISQHRHQKRLFFDMPGLYSDENMYNLIQRPNLKALLTWNKIYSPPVFLNNVFIYGGKIEIQDVKIILFGLGGGCSSDNRWFMLNYTQFWKGLPAPNKLQMQRHVLTVEFQQGVGEDIEIAGWGFVSLRLAYPGKKLAFKQLVLYLPKGIAFRMRRSVVKENEVLTYRSVVTKRHDIQRVQMQKQRKNANLDV